MTSSGADSAAVSEWTVLYHAPGKLKGRGEFLRLMLEDAGVSYADSGDNLYGPTGIMDIFRGSAEAIEAEQPSQPFPLLFPPAIWHRPHDGEQVIVNQVGACMEYLGDALGYAPSSSAERARATSILLNALDYINEGRNSFHPVKNNLEYSKQKAEGDAASKVFAAERMPKYLHHFNKVVKKAGSKNPVAGGKGVTYADFCLFHVIDATVHQFNGELYDSAWDNMDVPALKEFYEHFKSRPNLKAYWESDRCARKFVAECLVVSQMLQCPHGPAPFFRTAYAGDSMM
jgi:glutathione S-transferase